MTDVDAAGAAYILTADVDGLAGFPEAIGTAACMTCAGTIKNFEAIRV